MPPAARTRSVTAWMVAPLSQTLSTIRIRRPRNSELAEMEERRLGAGRPAVVVVRDGGHENVPDPKAIGKHPRRDHPAAGDRQHRVTGDAAYLLGERGAQAVQVVPRNNVAFDVDQPRPAGDGRDHVDRRVGLDRRLERRRPLAVDEDVDVRPDRRAGVAQPVGDPGHRTSRAAIRSPTVAASRSCGAGRPGPARPGNGEVHVDHRRQTTTASTDQIAGRFGAMAASDRPVRAAVQLARARPEIDPDRVELVTAIASRRTPR